MLVKRFVNINLELSNKQRTEGSVFGSIFRATKKLDPGLSQTSHVRLSVEKRRLTRVYWIVKSHSDSPVPHRTCTFLPSFLSNVKKPVRTWSFSCCLLSCYYVDYLLSHSPDSRTMRTIELRRIGEKPPLCCTLWRECQSPRGDTVHNPARSRINNININRCFVVVSVIRTYSLY